MDCFNREGHEDDIEQMNDDHVELEVDEGRRLKKIHRFISSPPFPLFWQETVPDTPAS